MQRNLVVAVAFAVLAAIGVFFLTRPGAPTAVATVAKSKTYRNTDPSLAELRTAMREVWIDGVLAKSLERIVPVELNFAERAQALHSPLRKADDGALLPEGTTLGELFESPSTRRRLLVIGQPGSGKTTQLLHLAERLLDTCDFVSKAPVPVILPLSAGSWKDDPAIKAEATDKQPQSESEKQKQKREQARARAWAEEVVLRALDWIATEISARYDVPRKQAHAWLIATNSPLVLLLDGLDEIRDAQDRENCAAVLTQLRLQYTFGMAVSCRSTEYFEMEHRLRFGMAVEIQPLTAHRVDGYLAAAGPQLDALREACQRDRSLAELFQNPLTLAIAVLTYAGRVPDTGLLQGTPKQRLEHLWTQYVEEMLHRRRDPTTARIGDPRFPPRVAYRWLVGLARSMQRAGRSEFRLQVMDLDWLPRRHSRFLYVTITAVWIALTGYGFVRATAAVAEQHGGGLAAFFDVVTVISLVLYLLLRAGSARLAVEWRFEPHRILLGLWYGLMAGLVLGIAIGTFSGPVGIAAGVIPGGLVGLVTGIATSAVPEPIREQKRTRRSATGQTLRVQLAITAGMAAVPVLTYVITLVYISSSEFAQRAVILSVGPSIGAVWAAATTNLRPWVAHRLAGSWAVASGILPRRLNQFLAHADERIIMRKTAGGYQFLHLSLQDYLANRAGHALGVEAGRQRIPDRRAAARARLEREMAERAAAPRRRNLDDPPTPTWVDGTTASSREVPTPPAAASPEFLTGAIGRIVALAGEEARSLARDHVSTEHLLLGIIREGSGPAPEALAALGVALPDARQGLMDLYGIRGYALYQLASQADRLRPHAELPLTPRGKRVIHLAESEAMLLDDPDVGPEHLLLAILREGDGVTFLRGGDGDAVRLLRQLGLQPDRVREELHFARRAVRHRAPPHHTEQDHTEQAAGEAGDQPDDGWPSLTGNLIVASPTLVDSHFDRGVLLVIRHGPDGAAGVVLNAPTKVSVGSVFGGWLRLAGLPSVVFSGGPVQPETHLCLGRLTDLSTSRPEYQPVTDVIRSINLADDVDVVASRFDTVRVFAGHVDWPTGELEKDIGADVFRIVGPVSEQPFARSPDDLYNRLSRRENVSELWLDTAAASSEHAATALEHLRRRRSSAT